MYFMKTKEYNCLFFLFRLIIPMDNFDTWSDLSTSKKDRSVYMTLGMFYPNASGDDFLQIYQARSNSKTESGYRISEGGGVTVKY